MATYDDPSGAWRGPASRSGRDALLLIARLAFGAIFVQSGFGKLANLSGFAAGFSAADAAPSTGCEATAAPDRS